MEENNLKEYIDFIDYLISFAGGDKRHLDVLRNKDLLTKSKNALFIFFKMAQIFEDFDKRHLTSFSVKTKTNIFCKQKSFDTHRQNRTQCLFFCFKLFQGNYGIIMLRFRDNWAQTF